MLRNTFDSGDRLVPYTNMRDPQEDIQATLRLGPYIYIYIYRQAPAELSRLVRFHTESTSSWAKNFDFVSEKAMVSCGVPIRKTKQKNNNLVSCGVPSKNKNKEGRTKGGSPSRAAEMTSLGLPSFFNQMMGMPVLAGKVFWMHQY